MNEQVLYHKCGTVIVQDADGTFRPYGSGSTSTSVLVCPTCGALLRDRDVYHTKSDISREKLRDVGWYPDPDGLALMDDTAQRANILSTLQESLSNMGDADLLAVYAIVVALMDERE